MSALMKSARVHRRDRDTLFEAAFVATEVETWSAGTLVSREALKTKLLTNEEHSTIYLVSHFSRVCVFKYDVLL